MRLIDADALIAEYDRVHVGAPGGARKLMQDAPTIELPTRQEEVTSHKNYKYLNSFWCECGCNLGKKWEVKYCPDCGKKVKWDG